ncbi:MAG: FtsW/RodA/SpoVE family cell cycle protein, partial [Clostridia bacterium]|nr:FtsW/RodA/SpoVE family cell cycle protein [Clostridia bacterium]
LPEPQNDYIFAILCEELGFIFASFVILLFVALVWRGFYIAKHAHNTFSSLVVIGIVSQVAIQTLFNIAVVTNTIPSTGISLPFFSYGGTSLMMLMAEMGIVLNISRYSYHEKG